MDALPIAYLHIETLVMPLFLGMLIMVQLARGAESNYYVPGGQRLLLISLVCFVGLCAVFGLLLLNVSPVLAGELAAGVTLALLHPVNALCFFVHLLFLRPWEIVPDNILLSALPRLGALLCLFSWLIHPNAHSNPTGRTLKGFWLVMAFSVWLFITTFGTPNISEAQAEYFRTYSKAAIIFVLTTFFIDDRRSLSQFSFTLVISALALMLVRFYQYQTEGPTFNRLESQGGMFGDPNDLAGVIVMALPFAIVPAFRQTGSLFKRVIGLIFAGFSALLIWYAQSRGAMLAVTAQLASGVSLLRVRNKWLATLVLAGFLGVGFLGAMRSIARDAGEMQESSQSRIIYWKAAANMTLRNPLLGVGFSQYANTYGGYSSGDRFEWGQRTAHSSWALVFSESGIPGGLLFVGFFLYVLKTAWRNRYLWPEQLFSVVGYGVVMSFLSHTYVFYFYVLSGLVLASESLKEKDDVI